MKLTVSRKCQLYLMMGSGELNRRERETEEDKRIDRINRMNGMLWSHLSAIED